MILANVDDSSLRGRQQVSKKQVEKLLKKTLRQSGYVVPNSLDCKVYNLNLYNRHNRKNDEKTVGFCAKKDGMEVWVFYRFNGMMAIFEKKYLEDCMARKDDAPFFKLTEEQTEAFPAPLKRD